MKTERAVVEIPVLVDITDSEFRDLSKLVYDQFGIHLTDKKKALVRGRLNKVLKTRGLKSFGAYLNLMQNDQTGLMLVELVDRISTNHTFFFREADHFALLEGQVLGSVRWSPREAPEVRIWCAGCATGEEAYTLAMVGLEWLRRSGAACTVKILATDISLTALEQALRGEYSEERVRLVPQALKERYFQHRGLDQWVIVPAVRDRILFKRLNFMDTPFPFRRQFHVIFCRNVMIYFDRPTKNHLVERMAGQLAAGGYFFIGHSETLGRETFGLEYVKPSVYRRSRA